MPNNLRQFSYDLRVNVPEQFRERQQEIILDAATIGAAHAVLVCPVDTGRLRASIRAQAIPGGAVMGSDVPYAGFQEFGTRKIAPRRYIQQGYEVALGYLEQQGFTRGTA